MKYYSIKSPSVLLVGLMIVAGACCEDDEPLQLENNESLVQATQVGSYSALELQALLALSGYSIPGSLDYDVDLYKIIYHSTYKGNPILASGVVIVPAAQSAGMISIQHGTIVRNGDAPSSMNAADFDLTVYSALASLGFITLLPDYIGFGSSSHIFHPYYVEDLAATAVVDMLKAAKELAANNHVTFNQKLFLGGYSQGGYVTMATHKYMETNELEGFDLLASFPAAGGYDIKGFQELLFTMDSYPHPYYIGYIALSYKITFNRNESLTDIFNEPYASAMPSLFDGSNSGSAIDGALTDDLELLMNPDFRDSLDTSPRFAYFKDALEANSLTDWAPTIKMFMYHGDSDTTVPHQNSVDTYNTLIANGASTEVLQFITLPGANHSDGVQPYLEDVIPKILSLYTTSL